jgi:hypothetical protein
MSATLLRLRPRIGRGWAGGTFAGQLDGYQLIVGAWNELPLAWAAATLWARDLTVGRCTDWRLPTVPELSSVAAAFPRLLRPEAYWTCEELASDAMVMHFGFDGLAASPGRDELGTWVQWDRVAHWAKIHDGHAIAVRRLQREVE